MAGMLPRETWTDARLDQFEKRIDDRFEQIDKRFDRLEGDIRELRRTVNYGIAVMVTGFLSLAGLIVF